MSTNPEPPSGNVEPELLQALSWEPEKRKEALDGLYHFVTREALKSIEWYLRNKESKRRGALFHRVGAIVMVGLAGLLPILSQLLTRGGRVVIQPAWASVAVLLAGVLIGLDRFYGFSLSWMRYIETELRLHHHLHAFQMDWERERAVWSDELSDDVTQRMIKHAKAFLAQIDEAVADETRGWIAEFRSTLTQLEEAMKHSAAREPS